MKPPAPGESRGKQTRETLMSTAEDRQGCWGPEVLNGMRTAENSGPLVLVSFKHRELFSLFGGPVLTHDHRGPPPQEEWAPITL